jgi:Fic-DOC domain mobile mystery protein B
MAIVASTLNDGETPLDDVSGLLLSNVGNRDQLNLAEAKNILKAVVKYLSSPNSGDLDPLSYTDMLAVHRDMFGEVWRWAGKLRTSDLNIGHPARKVELQLYDLSLRLDHWESMPLFEKIARLHHESVWIHPFQNGNGRWARMLANIWLIRLGYQPTLWPEAEIGSTSAIRSEYLSAMKFADSKNIHPLIELHQRYTPVD